jgi:hypothetical protein
MIANKNNDILVLSQANSISPAIASLSLDSTSDISFSESDAASISSTAALLAYRVTYSRTFCSYAFGSRRKRTAASPFRGSEALGYLSNCGRKISKILMASMLTGPLPGIPYVGDQVWLMTSRQTDPLLELAGERGWGVSTLHRCWGGKCGFGSRWRGTCMDIDRVILRGFSRHLLRMGLGLVLEVRGGLLSVGPWKRT